MGGRSVGKARLTDDGVMNFFGTLSLDNNGGFSSIRSGPIDVQMAIEDGFRVRLKGDGRTYFQFVPENPKDGIFIPCSLTKRGWSMDRVFVPLKTFVPTSFGRRVQEEVF